jgi:hypothetical protein
MTTGYSAGLDSSDVLLSYGEEATWAVIPAIAFQAVRMTGEGFSETKTRLRPKEINALGFAAHAITTQVQAQGSLNIAMSTGTYDDLMGGALNSAWTSTLAISAATISAVASGNKFHSTVTDAFTTILPGQWIKVAGFAAPNNNGFFRVVSRTVGATPDMVVAGGTTLTDAAASLTITITGSMLRNGTSIRTFSFQKQMASALFFQYLGSFVTSMNIKAALGDSLAGSFQFLTKQEAKATTNASTGSVAAAPTGRVIDNVTGFQGLQYNDTTISAVAQSLEFTMSKQNARNQYGLGSAASQGIGHGTLSLDGKISIYFKDFSLYDLYKAETDQQITFRALDNAGLGYIFTLPSVTLVNPQIVAGGPDTDLVSNFTLEGNAGASGAYNGVLLQIDRFLT